MPQGRRSGARGDGRSSRCTLREGPCSKSGARAPAGAYDLGRETSGSRCGNPASGKDREMTTFVVAHGAWSAGWAWRKMRDLLGVMPLRLRNGESMLPRSFIYCARAAPGDVLRQFDDRAQREGWGCYTMDA